MEGSRLRQRRVQPVIGRSELRTHRFELSRRCHLVKLKQESEPPSEGTARKVLYIVEEPRNLDAISADPESLCDFRDPAGVLRLAKSIKEGVLFVGDRNGPLLRHPDLGETEEVRRLDRDEAILVSMN